VSLQVYVFNSICVFVLYILYVWMYGLIAVVSIVSTHDLWPQPALLLWFVSDLNETVTCLCSGCNSQMSSTCGSLVKWINKWICWLWFDDGVDGVCGSESEGTGHGTRLSPVLQVWAEAMRLKCLLQGVSVSVTATASQLSPFKHIEIKPGISTLQFYFQSASCSFFVQMNHCT